MKKHALSWRACSRRIQTKLPDDGRRISFEVKSFSVNARYLTAVLGIPLVLFLVWLGGTAFAVVVAMLAFVAMRELELACRRAGWELVPFIVYPSLAALLWTTWNLARIAERQHTASVWLWLIPVVLLLAGVILFGSRRKYSLVSLAMTQLAVSYVGLFIFLILVRFFPSGGLHLFWILLLGVWTSDSAAYFAGRKFGKTAITPLSPGKTREGFVVGMVATIVVCGSLALYFGFGAWHAGAIAFLIALAAPFGDFIESFWKRELDAKDMGALLPGHGGILDRCDSLLLASFAIYLYALWQL